jgi:hypothetical protein
LFFLAGCGEDAVVEQKTEQQLSQPKKTEAEKASVTGQGAGGVAVQILPEEPTSEGCLRALTKGALGRSGIVWLVNDTIVKQGTEPTLCSDQYSRDDVVTVRVGTVDQGAEASVKIINSPPKVVNISSTPAEIYAGTDVTVSAVAEDPDGDDVDFSYQWLINGVENPELTEAVLPGSAFTKGDNIQVQIIPNDFFVDGPVYESYAMLVPNAAPRIVSEPPQGISSLEYTYQVAASDPDDSSFTFSLAEAPEGMTIDESSGLIEWSLIEATPGDHTIAILVRDPEGAEAAQEYTLSLSPAQQE